MGLYTENDNRKTRADQMLSAPFFILILSLVKSQGVGPWCRRCGETNGTDGRFNPKLMEHTCTGTECKREFSKCNTMQQCKPDEVCLTVFDLLKYDQIPVGFLNGSNPYVTLNTWMTCTSIAQLKSSKLLHDGKNQNQQDTLIEQTPQKCLINPELFNGRFLCLCTERDCNASPSFVKPLSVLAREYLKSETSEQGLFDGQIWILFMIVFGCGIIFITIGLIIVTIIKKRHNEEDHEHDFESSIQADDSDDSISADEDSKPFKFELKEKSDAKKIKESSSNS